MFNDEILRTVAERSPQSYADTIRERNQSLLSELEKHWKRVKVRVGQNYRVREVLEIGCPHCDTLRCHNCLWSEVTGNPHRGCCAIEFNGVTFQDVCDQRYINIGYSSGNASLNIFIYGNDWHHGSRIKHEYENAKKFLQGHIDWANQPYWGDDR